jgi:hypothetical protein
MSWSFKVENGDFIRTMGGSGYETIFGKDKLKQECKMVLTTDIRPDGVGSSLSRILGRLSDSQESISPGSTNAFEFQMMVGNAITRYRDAQKATRFSRRDIEELLDDNSPVYVTPYPDDTRKFKWRVDFFSLANSGNFSLGGVSQR